MVAGEEDRGDATTLVLDRPRVLRTLEESLGVGLVLERLALDDAGYKPGHRVDHDHRRELSAGEHEVADRELFVNVLLDHPLVDPFIVPAHDHEVRHGGESPRRGVIEERSLRAHERHVAGLAARGADRARQRLRLQDHAGAAPVRRVVDDAVTVGGPLTDVVDDELDLSSRSRPRDDALGEGALEHLREEREDVDPQRAHSATCCGTTTRRPPLRSVAPCTPPAKLNCPSGVLIFPYPPKPAFGNVCVAVWAKE